jgi:phosphatidate phosphatase APP1
MNRSLVGILLFAFLLGKATIVEAQPPIVRGTVRDNANNPLENVRISCDEVPDVVAKTDAEGNFALHFHSENRNMRVTIWISKRGEGYISCSRTIVVPDHSKILDSIKLYPLFIEGTILKAATGEPIVGARIVVRDGRILEAISDSTGYFRIASNHIHWSPAPGIEIRIEIGAQHVTAHVLVAYPRNTLRL